LLFHVKRAAPMPHGARRWIPCAADGSGCERGHHRGRQGSYGAYRFVLAMLAALSVGTVRSCETNPDPSACQRCGPWLRQVSRHWADPRRGALPRPLAERSRRGALASETSRRFHEVTRTPRWQPLQPVRTIVGGLTEELRPILAGAFSTPAEENTFRSAHAELPALRWFHVKRGLFAVMPGQLLSSAV